VIVDGPAGPPPHAASGAIATIDAIRHACTQKSRRVSRVIGR
jgi:hypothetical protein